MKIMGLKVFVTEIFLVISIAVAAAAVNWLTTTSVDQKIHDAYKKHESLMSEGRTKDAYVLFIEVLKEQQGDRLDPIWIPFIRIHGSGYERLSYFMRVLRHSPNMESLYKELSKLIESAPQIFHTEVKARYFSDLMAIDGIDKELLRKYRLISNTNSASEE